jgi:hypothetical protein
MEEPPTGHQTGQQQILTVEMPMEQEPPTGLIEQRQMLTFVMQTERERKIRTGKPFVPKELLPKVVR